ncbi:MAG: MATE family efflux transporter [Ruminococcaceae bacterium]|nr:MATE family efflux transporter [Oscillospiraceae bacterium]
MRKKHEIDMTSGSMLPSILAFSIPLILSGILQLLYNAADTVIVGRYAGKIYLAAVGATSSFNNLCVTVFLGLSVGANVLAARFYGSKDADGFSDVMHTSVLLSIFFGIFISFFGQIIITPTLKLMATPDDIINYSARYMQIIFIGMPATILYNYGAAIARAIGDTKRPLYILAFSGIINIVLNLIFVIKFNMNVSGVAVATVVSQYISALLILITLRHLDGLPPFSPKKLKINKNILFGIIRIGLPSGINGSIFSLSNVLIQSAVNSFGSDVVAGNSVGMSLEGFVYTAMIAFYHASITFMGQNHGAGKYNRLTKGLLTTVACVTVSGIIFGLIFYINRFTFASIYNSDPNVIHYSAYRNSIICLTYFLCGIMDVISGALRGLGKSIQPTLVSILSVCGLRIVYVLFIFPHMRSLFLLYASWPASWFICLIVQSILFAYYVKKIKTESFSKSAI